MENTNLPSGYPSAPGANESSGSLKKVLVSLVVVLLLGGAAAYAYLNFFAPKSVAKLDASTPPPSLQVAGGAKGSFVETTQGTLQFDTSDKTAYEANASALKSKYTTAGVAKSGVNYLFADQEITLEDVVKGVDPVANKLLLAYYDQGSFWTYPKGPFTGTKEIKKDDLKTFKIPKNRVVILITDKETTSYGLKSPTDKPSDLLTTAPIGDSESGWVLVASKPAKLADLIAPFGNRVVSAWALKGQNDFADKPVDLSNFTFSTYSIAWLQLTTKPAESPGTTTTNAPTITAVTPASLIQGQKAAKVTITGTNFTSPKVELKPATNFSSVGSATVASDGKKIELTLDVADNATLGPVEVKVITAAGSVANSTLAITQKALAAAKISSITPISLIQGDTDKELTITGENLLGAKVDSAQDMTIASQSTATDTTLKFKVNVAATAPIGLKEIKISKGTETVTDKSFEIKAKSSPVSELPTISSISPSFVTQGDTNVVIEIKGDNFVANETKIKFGDNETSAVELPAIAITSVTKTSIALKITKIADAATPGAKTFVVTTSKGTAKSSSFEVKAKAVIDTKPVITSFTPTEAKSGETINFELKGTNLSDVVSVFIGQIPMNNFSMKVESTSVKGSIEVYKSSGEGSKDVHVVTSKGQYIYAQSKFTVKPAGNPTELQVGSEVLFINIAAYTWQKGKIKSITGSGISAKYEIEGQKESYDTAHVANLAVHPDKIVKGFRGYIADAEPFKYGKGYWTTTAKSETEGRVTNDYYVKYNLKETYIPLAGLTDERPLSKDKKVLANWNAPAENKWSPAIITEVNGDNFTIQYIEDKSTTEKPKSKIAPYYYVSPKISDLKPGSQIVAESAYTPGTYWGATVQTVNSDGTATVTTNDDNTEYKNIKMSNLYIPGADDEWNIVIPVDTTKLLTDDANWTIQFVE